MTLQLIDLSLESPEENLALDEALLLEAEAAAAKAALTPGMISKSTPSRSRMRICSRIAP